MFVFGRDYFTHEEKEIKTDAGNFLQKVILALTNYFIKRGMSAKDIEFLRSNDTFVFRGTNIVVLSFSRSKFLARAVSGAFSLSMVVPSESNIKNGQRPLAICARNTNDPHTARGL